MTEAIVALRSAPCWPRDL